MVLTKNSTTEEKLLFLNKVNIILGFTVIFFHLSVLDNYRETFWLGTAVFLIVCSAIISCHNYIYCGRKDVAEFIAKDNIALFLHVRIPYLATYTGLLIYLSFFSWYLTVAFVFGGFAAGASHQITKRRMKK